MSKSEIYYLKQPCANRGLSIVDNDDGSVSIGGRRFLFSTECEDYLMSVSRQDIKL